MAHDGHPRSWGKFYSSCGINIKHHYIIKHPYDSGIKHCQRNQLLRTSTLQASRTAGVAPTSAWCSLVSFPCCNHHLLWFAMTIAGYSTNYCHYQYISIYFQYTANLLPIYHQLFTNRWWLPMLENGEWSSTIVPFDQYQQVSLTFQNLGLPNPDYLSATITGVFMPATVLNPLWSITKHQRSVNRWWSIMGHQLWKDHGQTSAAGNPWLTKRSQSKQITCVAHNWLG